MKTVLILGKYATTEKEGFETRTTELAYQFVVNDMATTVITSNSNHLAKFPKQKKTFNYNEHRGVYFWWIKCIQYQGSGSWKRILSWFEFEFKSIVLLSRLKKHDIIIATSLSLLSIITGIIYSKLWGSKLVFEIRDIWPLTLIEDANYSKFNPFIIILSLIERVGYRSSDYIIGTMPNLIEHVRKIAGDKHAHKVGFIPFGIHNDKSSPKNDIPNEIKFLKSKFKVAYAGSIGISNALDNFIDAIKILDKTNQDFHFFILGDGALLNKYKLILKNSKNINFLGKVERRSVSNYLENVDVVFFSAHPNKLWEYGFSPNKLIDYMRAKKPIIASYDGHQSIINEANCGMFIKAGCTTSIIAALEEMLKLPPEELEKMGYNGFEWIVRERNWESLGKKYLEILNKL